MSALSTPVKGQFRRARARQAGVTGVLALLIVVLAVCGLAFGKASVSPAEVLAAVLGRGDAMTEFVILELRMPRMVTALLAGACLGLSGAVLQSLLRNPLASPDIIGVTNSAGAAGVVGLIAFGLSGLRLTGAVLVGTLAATTAVYLLSRRRAGHQLVIVGIGVSALCVSVVSYMLTRTDVRDAQEALVWINGSLGRAGWDTSLTLAVCAAVLVPVALAYGRRLSVLELGDDPAAALGERVGRTRTLLLGLAAALAASAVAVVGPVPFVALVSAPIARRVTGSLALLPSALIGAVILLASDLVAQFAIPGVPLPAGVVTGVVGAPYLLWLLLRPAFRL
ncbi:iron chelate uptake ABC transporter family permease subunit [Actinocorallia sp. API 0066]|uniref:FecCD family ABC transporter permease n=1 Tax=Actinocorallia sp. API 0066 TaxID=2896846 RepID=UPI001E3B3A5E|nr:iron chelate uptake ABC transporter family permease subunit [Actinocorallia sp. API 0066]MCD0449184.1 iron chelate uptake ABC transporter family permease subunit [Actinocorallia sp. API 0066]